MSAGTQAMAHCILLGSHPCSRPRPASRTRRLALLAPLLIGAALTAAPAEAQQSGYGQTLGTEQQQRQLLDGGTSPSGRSGSILDSTNPIDLMNKLRRASAMNDATPPGTAIDQALRDFEAQSASPAPGPVSPTPAP